MTSPQLSASILFVHGAAHAGWCWEDHFVGWFEARGYAIGAPDLPHHGRHPRRGLRFASLQSYVKAVDEAASELRRPLILVGHSMGGFIVQKYLEEAPADLGVLLASIPPNGGSSFGRRLMRRYPIGFAKTIFTGRGSHSTRMTREMFFTADTPADIVEDCHKRLGRESLRILVDMNTPIRTELIKTPVIAIGAEADEIVALPEEVATMAEVYGTEAIQVPGGHCMMLDTHWEEAATAIERAIVDHVRPLRSTDFAGGTRGGSASHDHAHSDAVE
jgi:pimeloyl-ACP methyl ester carboxylesterase